MKDCESFELENCLYRKLSTDSSVSSVSGISAGVQPPPPALPPRSSHHQPLSRTSSNPPRTAYSPLAEEDVHPGGHDPALGIPFPAPETVVTSVPRLPELTSVREENEESRSMGKASSAGSLNSSPGAGGGSGERKKETKVVAANLDLDGSVAEDRV